MINCAVLTNSVLLIVVFSMSVAHGAQAENISVSDFSDEAAINQRLQQAQIELQQHASDSDPLTADLLKRLETTIYHHQAALNFLAAKEQQREQAEEAARSWKGFDQAAPYSVRFSDELRMQLVSLKELQRAADTRRRVIIDAIKLAAENLITYQRTERQLAETAEMAESAGFRQQALLSLQQNDLSSRIEVEKVAYMELRQRSVQADLAAFKARQGLVERQLKFIGGQIRFSQSELEEILGEIAGDRTRALRILNSSDGEVGESGAEIAWKAEFLDTEEMFWNTRYMAHSASGLRERERALDALRKVQQTVDAWAQAGETLADEQLIMEGDNAEDRLLRDDLLQIRRLRHQVEFAISDLEKTGIVGMELLNRVIDTALAAWGAELYLVEDSTSFEGRKVTTYRAITLGKLIRLAFILAIGWLALKFLARRLRRFASRRPGTTSATANSISRWTFGAGLGVLIIYGLKSVNIPFTAFAFLGGTLAIGIGFGAQNLVKNFISGIILILERPFKVGDLVEVDDISGRILRMGMRASVIEHFDGIETLVPNSVLLDNRVDNWTFGKTAIRGSVSVGIAYGSSTREVSRTLLSAALEHGQVLDRPEPEVRFEEFGSSSLDFQLLYWTDPNKTQRERLESDLRFMIDKALNEAGITVAFPQRDIHFDSTQPLQVEISSSPGLQKPESNDTKMVTE